MKKAVRWTAAGITAGLVLAATAANVFGAQLTTESAKAAALEHAGVEEKDTRYIRAELDREDGCRVYEVEFVTNDFVEYEYTLNAENGSIIDAGCDAEDAFYREQKTHSNTAASITIEKAKTIAATHANQEEEKLDFRKAKTDRDDGRTLYEIEFYTEANEKYEYEIDAASGTILQWEYEAFGY